VLQALNTIDCSPIPNEMITAARQLSELGSIDFDDDSLLFTIATQALRRQNLTA